MVGANVAQAIRDSGLPSSVVAQAADMRPADLDEALSGMRDLTFEQLVAVGGFLSSPVHDLFEGVTT